MYWHHYSNHVECHVSSSGTCSAMSPIWRAWPSPMLNHPRPSLRYCLTWTTPSRGDLTRASLLNVKRREPRTMPEQETPCITWTGEHPNIPEQKNWTSQNCVCDIGSGNLNQGTPLESRAKSCSIPELPVP